jgi:lysyl-tRNA synthetase class 2
MKRLLAAGSGPIYQLCKAFRDGEAGSRHNPEFTILEWYRPGWDHHELMDEVHELLVAVLHTDELPSAPEERPVAGVDPVPDPESSATGIGDPPSGSDRRPGQRSAAEPAATISGSERITYAEAFQRHAGLDPHTASTVELAEAARSRIDGAVPDLGDHRDGWLDVLLTHLVEPELGRAGPTFIHDYPASQAALARVRDGDPPVAERFEVWVDGIELANGYHELTDPDEQRRRFEADLASRRVRGLPGVPVDNRFLEALEHGIPSCAGVALGVDRLVMLAAGATRIRDVIAFPIDRA